MKIKSFLAVCVSLFALNAPAQVIATNNNLPPLNGQYVAAGTIVYNGGPFSISGLTLFNFSSNTVPPAPTFTVNSFFDVFVDLTLNTGGPSFPANNLVGPVTVQITGTGSGGGVSTYNTEMLQMNLTGLPGGAMVRESPIQASTGQTTITDLGGGNFKIDSFFDVFTELSLDGGATWMPSQGGTIMNLTSLPEPGTVALFSLGSAALFLKLRRKR